MINKEQLEQLAALSRIQLTEKEKESFVEQLNTQLSFVAPLLDVNTEGVEPTIHGVSLRNVFREDALVQSLSKEKVFQNAPEEEERQFKVPAVIE